MNTAGCLLKKGRIIKSNLKKRYFVLTGNHLYYYASKAVSAKGVGSAKGSDSLLGLKAAMVGQPESNTLVPIHLILPNDEQSMYYVNCPTLSESLAEAKRWVEAFVRLIPKQIKSVIQGNLEHSRDHGRTWTHRYVMLLTEELVIFDCEESSRSADPLSSALQRLRFTDDFFTADAGSLSSSGGSTGSKHPYAFQVCDLGETSYYLAAPDAQHKMFWMMAISKIIESLLKETVNISENTFSGATVIGVNPLQAAAEAEEQRERVASQRVALDLTEKPRGRLLYAFVAENDGEISIPQSEIVTLIEKVDDDFWICQYGNHRGFVQADYLEIIAPMKKKPPPQRKKRDAPPVPNRRNKPSVKIKSSSQMQKPSTFDETPRGSQHPGAPPPLFSPALSSNSSSMFRTTQGSQNLGQVPKKPPPAVPSRDLKPSKSLKKVASASRMNKIQALAEKRRAIELREKVAKEEALRLKQAEEERARRELEERRKSNKVRKAEQERLQQEREELEQLKQEEQKVDEMKKKQRRQSIQRKQLQAQKDKLEKERKRREAKLQREQEALRRAADKEDQRRAEQKRIEQKRRKKEEQEAKEKEQKAKDEAKSLKDEQETLEKAMRAEKAAKKIEDAQRKAIQASSGAKTRRSSMSRGKNSPARPVVVAQSNFQKKQVAPERKSTRKKGNKGGGGGIAARMAMWNKRANDYNDGQEKNVFSEKYKGAGGIPKRGDADYGKAVAGSATEKRAAAAKEW